MKNIHESAPMQNDTEYWDKHLKAPIKIGGM
jgi:hypothetical protein